LIDEYGQLKCSERPRNLSEARELLKVFEKQELAETHNTKKNGYRHHTTIDDKSGTRPLLILGGAFEMNRRRH
jgi:hypothetical protein